MDTVSNATKYRVLIVDDEFMIIKGLEKMIAWTELGLEYAGPAHHGVQALEIMKQEKIDIVITDINMPKLDGLSFIEQAKQTNSQVEFIIISGYEKFEYVKKGIGLGVNEYLLKPVSKTELTNTLKKVVGKLAMNQVIQEKNPIDKQTILNWFQEHKPNQDLPIGLGQVLSIYLVHPTSLDRAETELENIFRSNEWLLIGKYNGLISIMSIQSSSKNHPADCVGKITGLSPNRAHLAYHQLRKKFRNMQFYVGNSSHQKQISYLLDLPMMASGQVVESQSTPVLIRQIFYALENNQFRQISQLLESLHANFRFSGANKEEVSHVLTSFFIHKHPEFNLDKLESSNQYFNYCKEVVKKQADDLAYDRLHPTLKQVVELIEANYQEDFSLSALADQLHMNGMYLGQLFKKEFGISFSKYLNQYRIQRSKELLVTTNESISEISAKVGYQNQAYFYRIFKEIEGISPKEFRSLELYREDNDFHGSRSNPQ